MIGGTQTRGNIISHNTFEGENVNGIYVFSGAHHNNIENF